MLLFYYRKQNEEQFWKLIAMIRSELHVDGVIVTVLTQYSESPFLDDKDEQNVCIFCDRPPEEGCDQGAS
jgi:hypothetical protein